MHKNKKILCKIKDFPFNYFLSVKFPCAENKKTVDTAKKKLYNSCKYKKAVTKRVG